MNRCPGGVPQSQPLRPLLIFSAYPDYPQQYAQPQPADVQDEVWGVNQQNTGNGLTGVLPELSVEAEVVRSDQNVVRSKSRLLRIELDLVQNAGECVDENADQVVQEY